MIPVILAGGSGTRFWPLSRRQRPKQLLSLPGDDRPLIEVTVDRLQPLSSNDHPLRIVCRPELVEPTRRVLNNPAAVEFLEEPQARNTAPAIALATATMEAEFGDEPVGFFPADHFVGDQQGFETCIRHAARRARDGAIITLGIPPTRPETGYGYIETDEPPRTTGDAPRHHDVEAFVEKPDRKRAVEYLQSGRFLWNSGIFVFRPSTLWAEFERQRPQMWRCIAEIRRLLDDDPGNREAIDAAFGDLEALSIDYAVMERARRVEVIPARFRWSDVGHWAALDEIAETDEDNNVVEADALLDGVTDSVVVSSDRSRLIAASSLDNMVIVDTEDALLIVPKDRAQRVRKIVERLRDQDRDDLI